MEIQIDDHDTVWGTTSQLVVPEFLTRAQHGPRFATYGDDKDIGLRFLGGFNGKESKLVRLASHLILLTSGG